MHVVSTNSRGAHGRNSIFNAQFLMAEDLKHPCRSSLHTDTHTTLDAAVRVSRGLQGPKDDRLTPYQTTLLVVAGQTECASSVVLHKQIVIAVLVVNIMTAGALKLAAVQHVIVDCSARAHQAGRC